MKVKFKEDHYNSEFLTKGKVYDVIEESDEEYLIKTDTGYVYWYLKNCFEIVNENKTKKILQGELKYINGYGYDDGEFYIDNTLLYNELIEFENKKIKITIEEIDSNSN